MKSESRRIETECRGEKHLIPSVVLVAKATNPTSSLERVKQVMRLVASESDAGTWSNDDEWLRKLPVWFVGSFQGHSIKEILEDDTIWDFGSWLDAMRHRGWEWWCSFCRADFWSATLFRQEDVYSIEPLIYLVRQSGAFSVEISEE